MLSDSQRHALETFGFSDRFEASLNEIDPPPADVGRVAARHRHTYVVWTAAGELRLEVSPQLRKRGATGADLPAVGDWVAIQNDPPGPPAIEAVLQRSTRFSRHVAGDRTEEQVLAANVDVIFLVSALTTELNPRRIERYLTIAWESGARPVIVLNKSDLCSEVEIATAFEEVEAVAPLVEVLVTSTITGAGMEEFRAQLRPGQTGALLGSSGVGKSSLLNHLVGRDAMAVKDTRGDDKGRHTTTHRELVLLPSGGLLLDTPGMREMQLWDATDGLDAAFQEITDLAAGCKFSDCTHRSEPGCAVTAAVEAGELDRARLDSFHKLQKELRHLEIKVDKRAAIAERKKWRRLGQEGKTRARLR